MSCIQNVTYALFNVQGGTCMDLSGGDNVSIIGYQFHNGPNQAWLFQSTGRAQTYNVKSMGGNKYLSIAGAVHSGQRVVALDVPSAWRVEDEPGVDRGVRLLPANDPYFCIELSDHGNPTPGTPVLLTARWWGQSQVWRLQEIQ